MITYGTVPGPEPRGIYLNTLVQPGEDTEGKGPPSPNMTVRVGPARPTRSIETMLPASITWRRWSTRCRILLQSVGHMPAPSNAAVQMPASFLVALVLDKASTSSKMVEAALLAAHVRKHIFVRPSRHAAASAIGLEELILGGGRGGGKDLCEL